MTARRDKTKQGRSQLYRQIEASKTEQAKRAEERKLLLWRSSVTIDVAKLVLAGVVIGSVFQDSPYKIYAFVAGFLLFLVLLSFSYRWYKKGIKF